jgi:alpha-tubulin suppressor-like RCC1 family protein
MDSRQFVTLVLAGLLTFGCAGSDSTGPQDETPVESQAPDAATREAQPELVTAGTPISFRQMSGGMDHGCGIATDSRAYCWGRGNWGRLGNGTEDGKLQPAAVAGGLLFRWISAGYFHTCGVTTDYLAYCWGANGWRQLGAATASDKSLVPIAVDGGLAFRQITVGYYHTCGLTTANKIYCWGNSGKGQTGTGSGTSSLAPPTPVISTATFRQVDAGAWHTCAVTQTYKAFCWGTSDKGALGVGAGITFRNKPTAVAGGLSFLQVSSGYAHTCGVTTASKAYCWGNGGTGALGNGKSLNSWTPQVVSGGLSFTRITAGGSHSCAETTAQKAYCWGGNPDGQVGDGTALSNRPSPVVVKGGLLFSQVDAGYNHTCGVANSVGYCWGYNNWGQLGTGNLTKRLVPTKVAGAL